MDEAHLRTRAGLVVRLTEALAHVALRRWGVYPPDLFAWHRSLGGVPAWRCRHPDLCAYVERALGGETLRGLLAAGSVSAVVVRALDASLRPVCELVVRVDAFLFPEAVPPDAELLLGGVLTKAAQRIQPITPEPHSFEVAIELAKPETSTVVRDAVLSMRHALADELWAVDAPATALGDIIPVCSVRMSGVVLDVFCRRPASLDAPSYSVAH